mgnify:CR=1 FL=1
MHALFTDLFRIGASTNDFFGRVRTTTNSIGANVVGVQRLDDATEHCHLDENEQESRGCHIGGAA